MGSAVKRLRKVGPSLKAGKLPKRLISATGIADPGLVVVAGKCHEASVLNGSGTAGTSNFHTFIITHAIRSVNRDFYEAYSQSYSDQR